MNNVKTVMLGKGTIFAMAMGFILWQLFPLRGEITTPMLVIAAFFALVVSSAV